MGIPAALSSVPAITPYNQYVAAGGQTVFPYPFPITQDSDLIVVVNGVTQPTDGGYTLSGQGNPTGGNVTFTLGQTAGAIITVFRNIAIQRITQIGQNSGFSSTAFNAEYNNIYLIMQQLQESIALCLQIPNTNSPTPITILQPGSYANKYLAFDANGNPTPAALTSLGTLTAQIIGGLVYPTSAAESAAGVVPANLFIDYGVIDRYGSNAVPGTTDMSAALQAAVNQNLAGGASVRFRAGAYSIQTPPTFGSVVTIMKTLDIGGQGLSTQLIHNGVASTGPLFNMGQLNGWAIHDMIISGNSAHKNDGIYAGIVGGTEQIEWRVENVLALMAGVGLQVADTNDFVVRRFMSWVNNPPVLPVPQTVTPSDVGHHIHITGGFVNLGSFHDCITLPSNGFFGGSNAHRGILIDCTTSEGLSFYDCDVETYAGGFASNEVGFAVTSSGVVQQLLVNNLYCEGTQVQLSNVQFSKFQGISDNTALTSGNFVGTIVGGGAIRQNKFVACNVNVVNQSSATSYGNLWECCNVRTTWTDNSTGPTDRRLMCLFSGGLIRDWGGTDATSVTIPASTPNQTPNCFPSNYYRYVANGTSAAYAINAPLNPANGFELTIVIANLSGGAGPQPTFNAIFHMASNTPANPSNGNELTYVFKFNSSKWEQVNTPPTSIPA